MRRAGLIFAMLVFVAMPVGAGASGHASLAMLGFAGLFLLGNAVMRPASVRLDAPGDLAVQAVTATAFAALLVGLGQSLRALAGIEGSVELFGWLFAGAWALVLARIVWPPGLADRAARSAEAALREVHRAGERAREEAAEAERRATERTAADRRTAERKAAAHRSSERRAERRSGERRPDPRPDPLAQQALPAARNHIMPHPRTGMIGVRMRHHRRLHRPPGIDMKPARWTIQALAG